MKAVLLLLFSAAALCGIEIRSGAMLGRAYDAGAFYVRYGPREKWEQTYSGPEYRAEARGKLMNLRLTQALFEDEWMKEQPFDPERNTNAVIGALDFYRRHGVLMINVSLQGGNAGYDQAVNGVDRRNGYRWGPEKGSYVSAFLPDGSLKPGWMARLERLLRAADERGMIVNLMYFYQGQDELFQSTEAIHAAARNITDWLIDHDFRNLVIDVANEYDLPGPNWDFNGYIPQNILQLVDEVRERFHDRNAGYAVPISASSDGRMRYPDALLGIVDAVLIHGNGRTPRFKTARMEQLKDAERPVLMTEDDNGRSSTEEHLKAELASCDILFRQGAGWGYMPWVQAQRFPFRFLPAASAELRDDLPEKERDMVYFHAVLDHIAELTLKKAPRERGGR